MEERDDIGTLFKSAFEEHKAPLGEASWEMLNHSLGRRNFFHFNPFQFNIYYASSIVVCLFICWGVGTHYTYQQWRETRQAHHTLPPVPASIQPSSAPIQKVDQAEMAPQEREKEKLLGGKTKGEVVSLPFKEEAVMVVPKDYKADSLKVVPASELNEVRDDSDSSGRPKRTLYITKRDTIFKIDTIKTHKKQKKWF